MFNIETASASPPLTVTVVWSVAVFAFILLLGALVVPGGLCGIALLHMLAVPLLA